MVNSLWQSVVGHNKQKQVLQRAIQQNRLPSFLLFHGNSGIGKKLLALSIAQASNCESSDFCCGSCPSCIRIAKQESEALLIVASSEMQIKIDNIRELQERLRLKQYCKAFFVIIDAAEKLTPQAANALLKTLEEPNPNTYFVIVTSNKNSILPTVRSRAQSMGFAPLTSSELQQISDAPAWILNSAKGSMEAVNKLRNQEEMEFRRSTLNLFFTAPEATMHSAFETIKSLNKDKQHCAKVISYWQSAIRDSYYYSHKGEDIVNTDFLEKIANFSQKYQEKLDHLSQLSLKLEQDLGQNVDRNLLLENFWLTASQLQHP